jgi:diguanylate cyclase (GGDEF)-like protein
MSWASFAQRVLSLPRWQAICAITCASVAGSVSMTIVMMSLLGAAQKTFFIALLVATVIPTLVALPVAVVLTRLLRELDAARRLAQLLANTDALTGALNRRHFIETGTLMLARARHDATPMSVLMLDIDDFKKINDRHGHQAGDEVLRMFARICVKTLRPTDMLARWGGEEFVALLPATAPADAVRISARLCTAIAQGSVDTDRSAPIGVTVSVGVAASLDGSAQLDDLLARADAAMYQAKQAGKNGLKLAD